MSELIDYNNTGTESAIATDSGLSTGQTFLASTTYIIRSIKVKIGRSAATDSGTITLSVRTVSSNLPTTTVLGSATPFAQSSLSTTSTWTEITLITPVVVTSGVSYAICLICTNTNPAITYVVRTSNSTYANGRYCTTADGGSTWSLGAANIDYLFETWGSTGFITLQGNITITSTVTGDLYAAGIQPIYGQIDCTSNISGNLTVTGYILLIGTIDIICSLTGDLFVTGYQSLSGNIYITSEVTGTLTGGRRIEWFVTRPDGYNENKVWGYDSVLNMYRWQDSPDILSSSGGRYHQPLVVIGHNTIYFEAL